jgi:hypothetical protein
VSKFDLSRITYLASLPLMIKLPDGSDSGWTVNLMGPGHPKQDLLNAELRRFRAGLERAEAAAKAAGQPYEEDAEASSAFFAGWSAARVIGWSPVQFEGADFKATDENKLRIFKESAFGFARDQIQAALGRTQDFLPKSPKTSDPSPERISSSTSASPTAAPSESI